MRACPKFAAWIRDDLGPAFVSGLGTMFGIIGTEIGRLWSEAWAPGTLGASLLANLKSQRWRACGPRLKRTSPTS